MDPSCMPNPDDLELAERHIEELYQRITALEQENARMREALEDDCVTCLEPGSLPGNPDDGCRLTKCKNRAALAAQAKPEGTE